MRADRPECLVDLRWSGKPAAHGGNVQVITAPVASTKVVCDGPGEQRALNVEAATA